MTAAAQAAGKQQEHAELTAVACLMMLERVNYLISAEVRLPEDEMADRIADIMYAAFGLCPALRPYHRVQRAGDEADSGQTIALRRPAIR